MRACVRACMQAHSIRALAQMYGSASATVCTGVCMRVCACAPAKHHRHHGTAAPQRYHSSTAPRQHGSTAARQHGARAPQHHHTITAQQHNSVTAPWHHSKKSMIDGWSSFSHRDDRGAPQERLTRPQRTPPAWWNLQYQQAHPRQARAVSAM